MLIMLTSSTLIEYSVTYIYDVMMYQVFTLYDNSLSNISRPAEEKRP